MADPDLHDERRARIGSYLLTSNWTQARELVESDDWYLSDESQAVMAEVVADARERSDGSPAMEEYVELIVLAEQLLTQARSRGARATFAKLEALDAWLEELGAISETEALYWRLAADDALLGEPALAELRMLMVRAAARQDEERWQRLETLGRALHGVLSEGLGWLGVQVAEHMASVLRQARPNDAPVEYVSLAERAIALVEHERASPLWAELHLLLGGLLLECPAGTRADNIARAEQVYRTVCEQASSMGSQTLWVQGAIGLANALASTPTTAERQDEALRLFDDLIEHLRSGEETAELARVLGNQAVLLTRMTHGDVDARLERAIRLLEEARALYETLDAGATASARAGVLHNLGIAYARRRTGVRSQNVDLAVRALEAALALRSEAREPVGRERTLTALSEVYPEWTGADSLQHARALSEAAAQEARAISERAGAAASRHAGQAEFLRQRSALWIDLDARDAMPADEHVAWLLAVAANHEQAVATIPRASEPALWAEWMGGLGRVLGRLPRHGIRDRLDEAHACFEQAIDAVAPLNEPRLLRNLHARRGEFSHEIGDWVRSFESFTATAELGYELFDDFTLRASREAELQEVRGAALFAAYAAFRLGRLDDAVRMAEIQLGRSLVETTTTAIALRYAGEEDRDTITEVSARINRLQSKADRAGAPSEAVLADVRAKLADHLGVRPDLIGMRLTAVPESEDEARTRSSSDLDETLASLAAARAELRATVSRIRTSAPAARYGPLEASEVVAVAARVGQPLVYLMATVHGGVALIVMPDGRLEALPLESWSSDDSRRFLYGDEATPSFARGAFHGEVQALRDSLAEVLPTLRRAVTGPLSSWLRDHGHARAVFIPLGILRLLPLSAADISGSRFSYAPSARALALAAENVAVPPGPPSLLVVTDPTHDDMPPLGFATVEGCALAEIAHEARVAVTRLAGADATLEHVRDALPGATFVHFACHGRFRPAAPLETHLMLAGAEGLSVADVLARSADLSTARLVTLSACQTANVEYYRSPDESLGFPSALILAGVPAVVATLWPVDDVATAFLCGKMYERILTHGDEYAAALDRAREWLRTATNQTLAQESRRLHALLPPSDDATRTVLSRVARRFAWADRGATPYARPEHWAGFVLFGAG